MVKILKSPVFDDEQKTQQAYLLHVILWALIITPIPYVLFTFIQAPELADRSLTYVVIGEMANLFLLALLRRGHVRLVSIIQVTSSWSLLTVVAINGAGVSGQAYPFGYALIIVTAGILLGGQGATIITLLSIVVGGWMVYAEINNWWVFQPVIPPLSIWMVSIITFPMIAVLQNLAAQMTRAALARARQELAQRKITEVSLRESEQKFRTFIEQAVEGFVLVDEDGAIIEWNQAQEQLSGLLRAEVIGQPFWEVQFRMVLPERRLLSRVAEFKKITLEALRTGQSLFFYKPVEATIQTQTGDRKIIQQVIFPVKTDQGFRIGSVTRNITERKRAEAEREKLIADLETKNAELERFTYTVSHDLKSPLVTIGSFTGFLEKDVRAGNVERVKVDIKYINDAVDKMRRLLDELLELSRIGRLMNPPEHVPLAAIVAEALTLAEGRLAERGVRVRVAENLPVIYGDHTRLVEVVQNLVDNAAKFMGDQPQPYIEIGWREQEGEPVFFVKDNGLGIEPQYYQKVFGLFDKLVPKSEGTGIGLALVKRIVEVHGGRVWVESAGLGQGAVFCFTLPAAKPDEWSRQ